MRRPRARLRAGHGRSRAVRRQAVHRRRSLTGAALDCAKARPFGEVRPRGFHDDDLPAGLVRLGLDGIRLHDLRHAYGTALLAAGVHPKVASEALGHASVAFTMDTYQHVLPSLGDQAATAIDAAFGDAVRGQA
jgi:hypothetical protein